MKKYFKFRKDFRCNWYGILGAFDTTWLEEQIVEYKYTDGSKHKWYNTSKLLLGSKHHYADVFLFESEGETQEYADKLTETIAYVYFVKKEDEYDSIEKLCDAFVMYDEQFADDASFTHIVFASLEEAKKNMKYHTNKTIIYGAIWTDKGLIYVAKMNEKGEMELL